MKKLAFVLFVLIVQISIAQKIEIEFDNFIGFNCGLVRSYDSIIERKNHLATEMHTGLNRYVFDFNAKKVSMYYDNDYKRSATISQQSMHNGLYFLSIEDTESSTGKIVESKIVINTNKKDLKHPYMVLYFVSSVTNTTNGFMAMNSRHK